MGYLLHSHIHLIPKHSPSTKIHPIYSPYLLFENTMSRTKFNAMVSGLFQLGSSYEWIITKKAGRASKPDPLAVEDRESKAMNHPPFHWGVSESGISELNKLKEHQESGAKPPVKKMNKLYKKELALAFLLSYCCTQEPFISSRATFLLLAIPRQYSGDDGQYVFDKSLQTSMVLLMKFSYQ